MIGTEIWEREKMTFYSVFYNNLLAFNANMLLYWFIINVTCSTFMDKCNPTKNCLL